MTNQYEFWVSAICPVDGTTDIYSATLRTNGIVPVETLLAASAKFANAFIYQETLTAELQKMIGEGELTTVGRHSYVTVTCVAGEI